MLVVVFHGLEDHGQFASPINSIDGLIGSAERAISKLRLEGAVRFETLASNVKDHHGQSAPYIEIKCDSLQDYLRVKEALAGHVLPITGDLKSDY